MHKQKRRDNNCLTSTCFTSTCYICIYELAKPMYLRHFLRIYFTKSRWRCPSKRWSVNWIKFGNLMEKCFRRIAFQSLRVFQSPRRHRLCNSAEQPETGSKSNGEHMFVRKNQFHSRPPLITFSAFTNLRFSHLNGRVRTTARRRTKEKQIYSVSRVVSWLERLRVNFSATHRR